MNRLRQILKDRRGVAFPLIIAIVLVLVMLMCCISGIITPLSSCASVAFFR